MERLKVFFSKGDHARDYARRRGSLLVRNATSRLSPYLAHGALSPRMVFRELKAYETERIKNRSTRELTEELYQREFFHLVALARGDELYQAGGINHSDLEWADDPDLYDRWTNGMTGWPFVDAAMRELAATGYITNVARQNAACFLARDLEIDWRLGATYFERQLVDHEPCTNMGNWQRTAGVSPHALAHRFSIRRQAMRHDKDGSYTRQWLPELGDLPTATIHEMNGRDCHRETGMFGVRLATPIPGRSIARHGRNAADQAAGQSAIQFPGAPMHPDEMPATLSAPRTHTDVAWSRLLNEGSPVGYLRQTRTGGTLYSKDGYGWSGQPIDHDQELPQLMVNLYRHRIFHGDIVEMRPRAGVQAYHPMIVLVSGDSVCLYDQQVGRLVTMEDAWPPPSSPRAQRFLGSMYTDVAFGRRIDTLFVEHLAGPRVDLPDSFTLLGLMHLGLLASIGLQFVVWGHAGPVLSSLGCCADRSFISHGTGSRSGQA